MEKADKLDNTNVTYSGYVKWGTKLCRLKHLEGEGQYEQSKKLKIRKRNVVVAFRMTPEEAQELNVQLALSGLTKQDYLVKCYLEHEIRVVCGRGGSKTDEDVSGRNTGEIAVLKTEKGQRRNPDTIKTCAGNLRCGK